MSTVTLWTLGQLGGPPVHCWHVGGDIINKGSINLTVHNRDKRGSPFLVAKPHVMRSKLEYLFS